MLFAGLVGALFSCGDARYSRALLDAEETMQTRPDSAGDMIRAYTLAHTGKATSAADSALAALLRAEADYKLYVANTDTASLTRSADYFRRHDDRRRLMRADFQLAEMCSATGMLEEGFIPAWEGLDMATALGDAEYQGRLNQTISDFYMRRWNRLQAVDHARRAPVFFGMAGMEPHFRYAKINEATALINLRDYAEGLRIIDSLMPLIPAEDSAVRSVAFRTKMVAEYYMDLLPEARKSLAEAQRYATEKFRPEVRFEVDLALTEGRPDEARRMLDEWGRQLPDGGAEDMRYRYARYLYKRETGDSSGALLDFEKYRLLMGDTSTRYLNNSLNLLLAQYRAAQEVRARASDARARRWLAAGAAGALLALVAGGLAARAMRRRHHRELEEKVRTIGELTDAARTRDEGMRGLFREQLRRLNSLSMRYLKAPAGEAGREELLTRAKDALAELGSRQNMEELVKEFDMVHDGLATHIRAEMPRLKARDFHVLILLLAGVQPKVASAICGMRPEVCYTLKTRLRQRMLESDDGRLRKAADLLN